MKISGMNIDAITTFVKKLANLANPVELAAVLGHNDANAKDNDTPEDVAYRKGFSDAVRALAVEAQAALDK